ncbi:hypothetical protein K491DRAFT_271216 [Lophiostoma macrostomum CBS 122681]|uniref:Uncharacterized protein n=1 Tax=Lophiostoma macrostomum CBS 122681 TaxID=1314788 RepID=A0A6A6SJB6_9PLEO|nr:hypothetical protein K491DRAFT_271216 [Lophiostoma macrostomum CBS 122681]
MRWKSLRKSGMQSVKSSRRACSSTDTALLLKFPRELRNEIIDLVIAAPKAWNHDDIEAERQTRCHPIHTMSGEEWYSHPPSYRLNLSSYQPNALGLLLANHQLHSETTQRLTSKGSSPLSLEVAVVDETELWPTWTYIPCPSTRQVDRVDVTFHILGLLHRSNNRGSGFRQGCGGPPLISWGFMDILDRFLKLGPAGPLAAFEEYEDPIDLEYSVKVISMNFVTPTELPKGAHYIPPGIPIDRYRWRHYIPPEDSDFADKDWVMTGRHLAEFVAEVLDRLMNYMETFGSLLATRVGEVRMSVDGEPWRTWNVDAYIRDMGIQKEAWIEQTLKARAKFGLPLRDGDRETNT